MAPDVTTTPSSFLQATVMSNGDLQLLSRTSSTAFTLLYLNGLSKSNILVDLSARLVVSFTSLHFNGNFPVEPGLAGVY